MATPSTALSAPNQKRMTEDEYKLSFDCFKSDHGKAYASPLEEEQRYENFKANLDYIHKMNANFTRFQVEVTAKADLPVDEFKDYADNRVQNELMQPMHPGCFYCGGKHSDDEFQPGWG